MIETSAAQTNELAETREPIMAYPLDGKSPNVIKA